MKGKDLKKGALKKKPREQAMRPRVR